MSKKTEKRNCKVIRFYSKREPRVLRVALSELEAKLHCRNPKNNSRTNHSQAAQIRTSKYGSWVDSYVVER